LAGGGLAEKENDRGRCGPAPLPPSDVRVLRDLARAVADLAARDAACGKPDLWYRHNALEAGRPLVFCDPENGWQEIIPPEALQCESSLGRAWEWTLRREAFWGSGMNDDRVVTGVFDVGWEHTNSGWGLCETYTRGKTPGGSYVWDAPVKQESDISRLRFPEITVDREASGRMLALAQEVFGGILTVRRHHSWWWSLGMTQTLAHLRGLEQMMVDMLENPAIIHQLMGFLRDGHLRMLDYLQDEGLLCLNNAGDYVGSGGFGWTRELPTADFSGCVRTVDMWGFGESQETTAVSPAMFEEFVLPYQLPVLERFGLNCYGCCEPLHARWAAVRRIPRLRRVSVSPWCNVGRMAEMVQGDCILSIKPNPAVLAMDEFDEDLARRQVREALEAARGCRVEVVMKDCHTLRGDSSRVVRWTRIAREEAERAA